MIKDVLIVSQKAQRLDALTQTVCAAFSVEKCATAESFKRAAALCPNADLIIVNAPLADDFSGACAFNVLKSPAAQVILLTGGEYFDEMWQKSRETGVVVLQKPLDKRLLQNALKVVDAAFAAIASFAAENEKLKRRLDDVKLIERAKNILCRYLMISENEAHKYIEKHAMDMRLSKKQIAVNIISTYEG